MAIRFSTLFKQLPPWFNEPGDEDGVVIGSMGRLVRNLKGEVFPGWSTEESRKRVAEALTPVVRSIPGFKQAAHAEMTELSKQQRKLLLERKQITPCMAARQDGCHVFINKKQDTIAMLNEEEHLVIHQFKSGNRLINLVDELQKKARRIEEQIEVAYNEEYGYLTSMAAECGEGLQFYIVLHLPGHATLNQIDKLEKALNKMHLNISPFFNEYGEETGHLYVLFSTPIPADAMTDVVGHMINISENLVEKELLLRNKISIEDSMFITDAIGRTYGALQFGVLMGYPELLFTISHLRMAMELGMLICEKEKGELLARLNSLILYAAPTHLEYTSEETSQSVLKMLRMHLMKAMALDLHLNEQLYTPSFPTA